MTGQTKRQKLYELPKNDHDITIIIAFKQTLKLSIDDG
jgi:hypothetical protein